MDQASSNPMGRSPERPINFPDVFLYRGRAGDGADCMATFDQRTMLMSRTVAGIACRIRIPVRQYQAVALVLRDTAHIVRLLHRDAGLSIDVEEFDTFATAEEYRDRLAGFLGLPALILAGASHSASEAEATPVPRRNPALRRRRARFLARRRAGGGIALRRVDGREIIARH
jgi:hypothetical protein